MLAVFCASFGYEFKKVPGRFHAMSTDGRYLISSMGGTVEIYDVAQDKSYISDADYANGRSYTVGLGNLSNGQGIIVGATSELTPAYWRDGVWTELPMRDDVEKGFVNLANGITADGKYICGNVSIGDFSKGIRTTLFPVVWTRNTQGKYDEYEILPHPDKDFTGRAPQYISALSISDDGTLVVGQITGHDGFAHVPIVYTKDAEGKWSYHTYGLEEIANPDTQYPDWPTYEPQYPEYTDYMNADSVEAFNKAMELYNDSIDLYNQGLIQVNPNYPDQSKFLSDKDGYDAALNKYNEDYAAYSDSTSAFNAVYYGAITGRDFTFNNMLLSPNGKYLAMTLTSPDPNADPSDWQASLDRPVILDISNDYRFIKLEGKTIAAFSITNDGTVVGGSPASADTRNAFIYPSGTTEAIRFEDWIATKCLPAAVWVKENMTYSVSSIVGYDGETNNPIYSNPVDSIITGTMATNPDGNIFCTYVWDSWGTTGFTTYLMNIVDPNGSTDAIDNTRTHPIKISSANGAIVINGKVSEAYLYDLSGRKVGNLKESAGRKWGNGIYIVKATDINGNVTTKKVGVRE